MKINNENEKDKVTYKDVYESLWRCRDFELSHLWQRSIFLTAFLVMCFTAYGAVLIKLLGACENHFTLINLLAFVISIVGIIFSSLWIMMGKSSKAWYEVYEHAISAFSENEDYFMHNNVSDIAGFKHENMKNYELLDLNKNLFSGEGGTYSPSRINIAIGQISLVIWGVILIFHIILIVPGNGFISTVCLQYLVLYIGGPLAIAIFFGCAFSKSWLHSKTLEGKKKIKEKRHNKRHKKIVRDVRIIK